MESRRFDKDIGKEDATRASRGLIPRREFLQ
jgi:hypothetical protein